jgi:acid phosphatase family membrane protein YuiD
MKYLLVILVSHIATHIVKFLVFTWQRRKFVGNRVFWSYMWLGHFPSVHSSALASILYLIWWQQGVSILFAFAAVISVIIIYGLLEDKKRQILYEQYFLSSGNESLAKISKDGILRDFSGHTFFDIVSGVIIGLLVSIVVVHFL